MEDEKKTSPPPVFGPQLCDFCQANPATLLCTDCEPNIRHLCSDCDPVLHSVGKRTSHGPRQPIVPQVAPSTGPSVNNFCSKHPHYPLDYVCQTCDDILICPLCVLEDHTSHTYQTTGDAIQRLTSELTELRDRSSKNLTEIQAKMEQSIVRAENQAPLVQENLRKSFGELMQSLEHQRDELLSKAEQIRAEKSQELQKIVEEKIESVLRVLVEVDHLPEKRAQFPLYDELYLELQRLKAQLPQTISIPFTSFELKVAMKDDPATLIAAEVTTSPLGEQVVISDPTLVPKKKETEEDEELINPLGNGSDGYLDISSALSLAWKPEFNYTSVTIRRGGILSVTGWDGEHGGSLIMKIQGKLLVEEGGSIDVSYKGYRGAPAPELNNVGYAGESISGVGSKFTCNDSRFASGLACIEPNVGGGGGGLSSSLYGSAGGGGAGYGAPGNPANPNTYGSGSYPSGKAGRAYGNRDLDVLHLGSGGGSGGSYSSSPGGRGGNGGGALQITAAEVEINGMVLASGEPGEKAPQEGSYYGSGGGGGSGGSIRISATQAFSVGAAAQILARGGDAGDPASTSCSGINSRGGRGGVGRVRLDCVAAEPKPTEGALLDPEPYLTNSLE